VTKPNPEQTETCDICDDEMDPTVGHESCDLGELASWNESFGLDVDGRPLDNPDF
jgi:hypothetical protein